MTHIQNSDYIKTRSPHVRMVFRCASKLCELFFILHIGIVIFFQDLTSVPYYFAAVLILTSHIIQIIEDNTYCTSTAAQECKKKKSSADGFYHEITVVVLD